MTESTLPPAVDEPVEPRAPALVTRRYDYTAAALARALGLSGHVYAISADGDKWQIFTQEGESA